MSQSLEEQATFRIEHTIEGSERESTISLNLSDRDTILISFIVSSTPFSLDSKHSLYPSRANHLPYKTPRKIGRDIGTIFQ